VNVCCVAFKPKEIVPVGYLPPNAIRLPGIFVDRIVRATARQEVESFTIAVPPEPDENRPNEVPARRRVIQ